MLADFCPTKGIFLGKPGKEICGIFTKTDCMYVFPTIYPENALTVTEMKINTIIW